MDIGRQQRVIVVEDLTITADAPAGPDTASPFGTAPGVEGSGPGDLPGDEGAHTPRTETRDAP